MPNVPRAWLHQTQIHRAIQRGHRIGWIDGRFEIHGRQPRQFRLAQSSKISMNIVLRGRGSFEDQHGTTHELSAGTMFLRLPGLQQRSIYDARSNYAEFHLSIDRFTSAELLNADLINQTQVCYTGPLLQWKLDLLRELYDGMASPEHQRSGNSLLLHCLHMIDRWQRHTPNDHHASVEEQAVSRACQLLADPAHMESSIRDVAAAVNMSEVQMRRAFNRQLGMSPRSWHSRYRFSRACELLADMSVTDVAAQLGFCDPYSFSTQFKKHMGVAPSHYHS